MTLNGATLTECEVVSECGVCGASAWRPAGTLQGHRYGTCDRCGVVRLVDRVHESGVAGIYAHYYAPGDPTGAELDRQLSNPTFAHRRKRLEAAIGSRDRLIFEIGCGDGNFLASLKRHGWKVGGSEVGSATVAMVARRHGITIMGADATRTRPDGAPFPVVAAYHVLEHVYHPREWLTHVRDLLEPDGLVHLQVPNWASLAHALSGMTWFSMRLPQHVYFYTPATLRALLTRVGFEPLSTTTWDPWHGPGAASASMIARVRSLLGTRSPVGIDPGAVSEAARTPDVPEAPQPRALRRAVDLAGYAAARLEALIGRGAVVDIVAARR